jgi:hypothetical protein
MHLFLELRNPTFRRASVTLFPTSPDVTSSPIHPPTPHLTVILPKLNRIPSLAHPQPPSNPATPPPDTNSHENSPSPHLSHSSSLPLAEKSDEKETSPRSPFSWIRRQPSRELPPAETSNKQVPLSTFLFIYIKK